jgi:signal transduction histidine kinase
MKEKPIQVLLVEDNEGDARLLRQMFRKEKPGSFELTHLSRMTQALSHLAHGGVDIVLLDMGLPDGHGLDTVRRARTAAPGVPLIVLTGLDDEELAAGAMKEGAQDYLIKGQIENRALPRALRHAIDRQRMQTETELIRTNQLQFKDEFLSHVSHELRSPLTAIYQFVTILLDRLAGDLNPEQHDYLEIVLRNIKQLQSMINDLLEVTRSLAGKLSVELQRVSISETIVYAVHTLQGIAGTKGISLSFDASARLPLAYADPTRLRQILIILLDNAIKFTPAGGAVKVQAGVSEKDHFFLLVEVSDTGCGIGPDMTERIFERLYQITDSSEAGRKGLGLGLHISKELVTRLGGTIWVTSELRKGSCFSFTVLIFSLTTWIGPMLAYAKPSGNAIVLFTVAMESRTGWPSPELRKEMSDLVRLLLQQCLRPDTDVLLPNMDVLSARELFFIVVRTQEYGAEIISERIRRHLRQSELLQSTDLTFAVSYAFLTPMAEGVNAAMETVVKNLAAEIEHRINTTCSERSVST